VLRRFLNFFRPSQLEAELREELEFHRGQTKGSFGNMTLVLEDTRAASTIVWLETLLQDIRYGLRQLRRAPGLFAVAVISLGLGIGANTAIFTLINAVMLQNLPVQDPGRLVLFYDGVNDGVYSGDGFPGDIFSFASWEYFRDHNESFQGLCAFRQSSDRLVMHLAGSETSGPKEQAEGHLVSGSYFDVLGVRAAAGRMLTPEDDTLVAPPVAVISYQFWRDRLHLDRSAIGKVVDLNGTAFTIIGVAEQEFFGERVQRPPDFWLPLTRQAEVLQRESWLAKRDVYWLNLIGRLKPGVTMQGASSKSPSLACSQPVFSPPAMGCDATKRRGKAAFSQRATQAPLTLPTSVTRQPLGASLAIFFRVDSKRVKGVQRTIRSAPAQALARSVVAWLSTPWRLALARRLASLPKPQTCSASLRLRAVSPMEPPSRPTPTIKSFLT